MSNKEKYTRREKSWLNRRRLFRHIFGRLYHKWIGYAGVQRVGVVLVAVLHLLNVHCTLPCLSLSLSFRDHFSPRHAIPCARLCFQFETNRLDKKKASTLWAVVVSNTKSSFSVEKKNDSTDEERNKDIINIYRRKGLCVLYIYIFLASGRRQPSSLFRFFISENVCAYTTRFFLV